MKDNCFMASLESKSGKQRNKIGKGKVFARSRFKKREGSNRCRCWRQREGIHANMLVIQSAKYDNEQQKRYRKLAFSSPDFI